MEDTFKGCIGRGKIQFSDTPAKKDSGKRGKYKMVKWVVPSMVPEILSFHG